MNYPKNLPPPRHSNGDDAPERPLPAKNRGLLRLAKAQVRAHVLPAPMPKCRECAGRGRTAPAGCSRCDGDAAKAVVVGSDGVPRLAEEVRNDG